MSLPTPAQLAQAAQNISGAASSELNVLGFTLNASELQAIMQVAVDAACMAAWKQAQAAGKAAADAITTEAQAEAAQRTP